VVAVACEAFGGERSGDRRSWVEHGADEVHVLQIRAGDQDAQLSSFELLWNDGFPRLILASADRVGRAWSARLAARRNWRLVSPALQVRVRESRLIATWLDASGRRARLEELPPDRPAIVALRPGVAQPGMADARRQGTIHEHAYPATA